MQNSRANNLVNLDDFAYKNSNMKSPIAELTNLLVKAINRDKLTYDQLRFATKRAREKTELEYPKRAKKLPQMPSIEELNVFFGSISNSIHRLIFEALRGTGLRVAELANLKVVDIDFGNNTIFVREGKGSKDRVAIIGNDLKEKLQIYLNGRNNIYLFESNRNTKYSTRRLQQLCTKYATGIATPITCHTFRHLFITNLADNNISREIREIIAGHAKGSKAHDVYLHLSIGDRNKEEIINILDKRK